VDVCLKVLKLSCSVSEVFPKVLKLSSEVSVCKPLGGGGGGGYGSDSSDLAVSFDRDDQRSHQRLGAHRAIEREVAKLRSDLDGMLAMPLGKKAENRRGLASVRYPTRGGGEAGAYTRPLLTST